MEVNNYSEKKIIVNADIFNTFEEEKFSIAKRSRSNSLTIEGNRSDELTEGVPQLESQPIKLINRRQTVDFTGSDFQRGITKKDLRITYKMTPKFKESRDIIFAEKRKYVHKIKKVKLKEDGDKPHTPIRRKRTRTFYTPKIRKIKRVAQDKNEILNEDKINKVVADKIVPHAGELPKQLNGSTPTNKLYFIKNAAGKKVPLYLKTKTVLLKSTPELAKILVKNDNASSNNYCKIVEGTQALACGQKLNEILGTKNEVSTNTSDLIKTVKIPKITPEKNPELTPFNSVQKRSIVNLKQPYVMKKMHFVADASTQTPAENLPTSCQDVGVQTDYIDMSQTCGIIQSELNNFDGDLLPNIEELVTYLLENENNSDNCRAQLLTDMSKKIQTKILKDNEVSNSLKRALFFDLKDCVLANFQGNMPIHTAVIQGDLYILKRQCFALRTRQISVDILNTQGQTPLQLAISEDHDHMIVSTLLFHGANVNILDDNGNNLFHLTVMHSSTASLEQLSQYFTNLPKAINAKNDEGMTPLMLACVESKFELIECLLEHGANPNIRDDKSGRTALFHAIELDLGDVIHLLLGYKADPKIRNFLGQTCIDVARDLNSNVEIFENPANGLDLMMDNKKNDFDLSSSRTDPLELPRIPLSVPQNLKSKKTPKKRTKQPSMKTVPALIKLPLKRPQNSVPKTSPKKKK